MHIAIISEFIGYKQDKFKQQDDNFHKDTLKKVINNENFNFYNTIY